MEVFAKCGMRCDLCLIYRPNVEREDRRREICAVWKKQNLNFSGDPETIICDGCACEREDAVLFDRNCRTRKCVLDLKRGMSTAASAKATPVIFSRQSPVRRRSPG